MENDFVLTDEVLTDEEEDEYDEYDGHYRSYIKRYSCDKGYSSSSPWNAPGMSVYDFI